mmetsp:Transcript_42330/g.75850  ORF Transcript_42330/g.75850 Transcript_42330/m.75850 type:complete len:147 (+) Transcript_42330:496-936(+)
MNGWNLEPGTWEAAGLRQTPPHQEPAQQMRRPGPTAEDLAAVWAGVASLAGFHPSLVQLCLTAWTPLAWLATNSIEPFYQRCFNVKKSAMLLARLSGLTGLAANFSGVVTPLYTSIVLVPFCWPNKMSVSNRSPTMQILDLGMPSF